jgi:hypothetical protein
VVSITPRPLYPRSKAPVAHWIGGWVSPRHYFQLFVRKGGPYFVTVIFLTTNIISFTSSENFGLSKREHSAHHILTPRHESPLEIRIDTIEKNEMGHRTSCAKSFRSLTIVRKGFTLITEMRPSSLSLFAAVVCSGSELFVVCLGLMTYVASYTMRFRLNLNTRSRVISLTVT